MSEEARRLLEQASASEGALLELADRVQELGLSPAQLDEALELACQWKKQGALKALMRAGAKAGDAKRQVELIERLLRKEDGSEPAQRGQDWKGQGRDERCESMILKICPEKSEALPLSRALEAALRQGMTRSAEAIAQRMIWTDRALGETLMAMGVGGFAQGKELRGWERLSQRAGELIAKKKNAELRELGAKLGAHWIMSRKEELAMRLFAAMSLEQPELLAVAPGVARELERVAPSIQRWLRSQQEKKELEAQSQEAGEQKTRSKRI